MLRVVDSTLLLPLLFAAVLAAQAPGLGIFAHPLIFGVLLVMLVTGRLLGRVLGMADDPFLAFVSGFAILAHVLLAAAFIVPGAHWQLALLLGAVGLAFWRPDHARGGWSAVGLGTAAALFTFSWCWDIGPRLQHFYSTGELLFWNDFFFHSATLAQFGSDFAIGQGMPLLPGVPAPLYHYASFLPPALVARVAGLPMLDATFLVWLPLGMVVMACGIVSLGLALGGPAVAVLALAAVAIMPDPARFTLDNGLLDFAWLLETHPGTPYSLGVSCAALAAVVRWHRDQRFSTLAMAGFLTASCFLVRFNTFFWLAPTVGLSAVACWRWLPGRIRAGAVALGVVGLVGALAVLSFSALREWPLGYLIRYSEFVHKAQAPTAFDGLYPALVSHVGRLPAAVLGVGLTFLGTAGPWLPLFLILGAVAWWRRRVEVSDSIPLLLLLVAAIAFALAPTPPSGDFTEFRHRPGALLVVVLAAWTVRFGALLLRPSAQAQAGAPPARGVPMRPAMAVAAAAGLAFVVQGLTVTAAKRPHMGWGSEFWGTHSSPALVQIAPLLRERLDARPRFVVASPPAREVFEDDAARLAALSGVPAYLSYTSFLARTGRPAVDGARRQRLEAISQLDQASSLDALQATMRANGITYYVVTRPDEAAFDPERRAAIGRSGPFAVYAANP